MSGFVSSLFSFGKSKPANGGDNAAAANPSGVNANAGVAQAEQPAFGAFGAPAAGAAMQPPPMMQQQQPMMMQQQQCCQMPQQMMGMGYGGGASNKSITVIKQTEENADAEEGAAAAADADALELAAVIVTIRRGGSYDDLFARVKQKAAEGTRVACYLVNNYTPDELQAVVAGEGDAPGEGDDQQDTARQMRADIDAVAPESVVFNWECCGGCSGDNFGGGSPTALMAALLARGFMVMTSDFSLGALIAHWEADALGPNPFKKVGEFNTQLTLRFDPAALVACQDSAQLQMLGELCATGEAHVHAMGGTKAYTVDRNVAPDGSAHGWAELEVLTIVTKLGGKEPSAFTRKDNELCTIGEHRGLAGHVVLRYPSGGRLLASCPHWIELSKLDVNAEQLLQVAEARYGKAYAGKMKSAMASMAGGAAKRAYVAQQACQFVQQSAPAQYSKAKKGGGGMMKKG